MSIAVFLSLFLYSGYVDAFYTEFLKSRRIDRHCHGSEQKSGALIPLEGSEFNLLLILISGLIFFLIFLGIIKGLIGLWCWAKLGAYGLNLLIDLPRPLPCYQEKSLKFRPVVYDVGGWPVHPDTFKKTVRVLPKRTEFCLNLVFFLACPLAAFVFICSFCCCIRNYKSKDDVCFKHVDVVKLTNNKNGASLDVYSEDEKEAQDTKYVLDAMQKSRVSIDEIRLCTNDK